MSTHLSSHSVNFCESRGLVFSSSVLEIWRLKNLLIGVLPSGQLGGEGRLGSEGVRSRFRTQPTVMRKLKHETASAFITAICLQRWC